MRRAAARPALSPVDPITRSGFCRTNCRAPLRRRVGVPGRLRVSGVGPGSLRGSIASSGSRKATEDTTSNRLVERNVVERCLLVEGSSNVPANGQISAPNSILAETLRREGHRELSDSLAHGARSYRGPARRMCFGGWGYRLCPSGRPREQNPALGRRDFRCASLSLLGDEQESLRDEADPGNQRGVLDSPKRSRGSPDPGSPELRARRRAGGPSAVVVSRCSARWGRSCLAPRRCRRCRRP